MTEKEFVEFAHMQMDLLRTEICHMREKRDMALWENAIDAKDLAYWRDACKRLISEKLNAIRERDELRKQRFEVDEAEENARLRIENALRSERDYARCWVCEVLANPSLITGLDKPGDGTKRAFAKEQGWDCFKEENHNA